jgi:hypothetical protein
LLIGGAILKIICKINESTLDVNPKNVLVVESDSWPAINVILKFEDKSIKVNAEALHKAIDNCCNV